MPPSTRRRSRGERAWDDNARAWFAYVNSSADWSRRYLIEPGLKRLLGDVRGVRILDAGCGDGHFSRQLARRGARVTGVDYSARLIEIARSEEERRPRGIRYEVGDVTRRGGLGRGRFDVVLGCQVLMALPDYPAALREMARALHPAGRLVVTINHPCFLLPEDGNYFQSTAIWWKFFEGQVSPTAVYHRPLELYVAALGAAGLAITRVAEPRIAAAVARRKKMLKEARKSAIFLLLEARPVRG